MTTTPTEIVVSAGSDARSTWAWFCATPGLSAA